MNEERPPRVLVFVVAYYAESTILDVLQRIPPLDRYDVEVLIIDDGSADATYALAERLRRLGHYRHRLTVLANPVNQGYGGNQKLGYHYAIEQGFDFVALLHGDGQYAPELLPELLAPLARREADVVLGSRMLVKRNALRGGMPLYKFVGNQLLTWYQNRVLRCRLSEFHTGYKVCSVELLRRIPFELNSNVFHFDTEIIIQFLRARARMVEVPIPTHYGNEVSRVNGLRYAWDVMIASTVARLQEYSLVYRRNFDVPVPPSPAERSRLEFPSTQSAALAETPNDVTVLTLGPTPADLSAAFRAKGCRVIGIDRVAPDADANVDELHVADFDTAPFPRPLDDVHTVLVLDVIEHLVSPENFCDELRRRAQSNLAVKIILSTANVGYFVTRLTLLLGQFNYNKRGILDLTHTRLFTFSSFRRLLKETGFVIEKEKGIPAPAPLVVKSAFWRRWIMRLQSLLLRVSRGLFAYQIFVVVRPLPTLQTLMRDARHYSAQRASAIDHPPAK